MKKNKEQQPKEKDFGENLASPFANLKFDAPPPPEPPKPPPPPQPTKEELMEAGLSRADKAMLDAFKKAGAVPASIGSSKAKDEEETPSGPKLTLVVQRKGHKGKTVTLVHGLKDLSTEERMILCSEVKTALGIGARFVEAVLELQGDQRKRAADLLESKNFRCSIP